MFKINFYGEGIEPSMSIVLWLIYLVFGCLIAAPLFHSDLFQVNPKYRLFRYVSWVLVLWWLIDFFRLTNKNSPFIYYLSLLIFPIVMLFTILCYLAILRVYEKKVSKTVLLFLGFLFLLNLALSLTNQFHQWYVVLPYSSLVTFDLFVQAPLGPLFFVHTGISYLLLIFLIISVLKRFLYQFRTRFDYFPLVIIVSAIIIGVVLNLIHIFFYTFTLDPTLLAIAIFIGVLYYALYIRDLQLILGLNRNRFILEHLREKFVIVNEDGLVVDASKEFVNSFDIDLNIGIPYQDLLREIEKKAVLFESSKEVSTEFQEDKKYFNFFEKPIYLPFYKKTGTFYLFFDQTTNLKYMNDMNYIKEHDLMTKIYNRNFLEEIRNQLDDEMKQYYVVLFDVDGLKLFNDYLGHEQGDDLLIRFASYLNQNILNPNTYAIRLGGDEFLLLAVEQTEAVIDNMLKKLHSLTHSNEILENIEFSYAVSCSTMERNTVKKVIEDADKKMYEMKQNKQSYRIKLEEALSKHEHQRSK